MSKIEIANPLPGGMKFTSSDRAKHFCTIGMADMTRDGQLLFKIENQNRKIGNQNRKISELTEEEEFKKNHGGDDGNEPTLWWNGARAQYDSLGRDHARFTPGCNVVYPKNGSARAARRYGCIRKQESISVE